MKRRQFLQCGLAATMATPLMAALSQDRLDSAAAQLSKAVSNGKVTSAVLHVSHQGTAFTRHFGQANDDSMFLLGSISKPICVTALMTLFDQGQFRLDDPARKYLPGFTGDGRDSVTVQHLLTHVSGLPDQLANNNALRKSHATLEQFVEHTLRTPLEFTPGSRYQYSSMAILLACHIAERISGINILELVDRTVLQPLKMTHSALGLGRFKLEDLVPTQVEFAAPEAGGGDPTAREWDWNSSYWRKLGSPWGGVHASAADIARYLDELMHARGAAVKPETAKLMTRNHNPAGIESRGLGLDVGLNSVLKVSAKTFGHSGSTGTYAWADPESDTICVVLTSLPARAMTPHPRDLASAEVAAAVS